MSNVKKIKVGSTSYDCKDATARTQVGRINLTKSGNNLVFTDSNGTQHNIDMSSMSAKYDYVFSYSNYPSDAVCITNLKTGEAVKSSGSTVTAFGITGTWQRGSGIWQVAFNVHVDGQPLWGGDTYTNVTTLPAGSMSGNQMGAMFKLH